MANCGQRVAAPNSNAVNMSAFVGFVTLIAFLRVDGWDRLIRAASGIGKL